ncbi:hypothetical protein BDV59DRAFT_70302 [Aspergillus ambiguus]|uniref:uncharacterized protein n=1 Tax=Aspergillus ambiguus TaxID=176160 RepID=UPI003CCD4B8D
MEILVYLLQMTADWKWTSQYELEVLLTITGVVVMESVRNPQIKLEPWVWKVVEKIEAPDSVRSQKVGCRAARKDPERFPSLGLRRIIEVVQLVREPSQHCSNLEYRYQQLLDDREKLKRQPKALFYSNDPITQQKPPQVQLGFQTRRATVLTLAMLANVVLQELSPSNTSLSTERDILVDESIAASQIPNHYRPLGACYVTHCLIVAYTVTRDAKQQEIIARLLNELCNLDVTPVTTSRWLEEGVQGWRSKLESLRQLAPGLVLLSAAICRQAGRQE